MKVTFTGYKNAMAASFISSNEHSGEKSLLHALSCQITNDFHGNDLDNYLLKMKKSGCKLNPNNTNFMTIVSKIPENGGLPEILLNGHLLEVKDKNLGVFSFCAQFLKNIVLKMKNHVAKDYFRSEDFNKNLIPDYDLTEVLEKNQYNEISQNMIKDEEVHARAQNILDGITDLMDDYFA